MRIASVIRPESVNANYRARIPLVSLAERGHEYMLVSAHDLPHAQQFAGFDVVHFCRIWEQPFQQLARALRDAGIGVTWDCDDDLTAIEKETSSWKIIGGFHRQELSRDIEEMLRLAHVVTTPSRVLAEQFAAVADDVRVTENHLAPPMILDVLPQRINDNLRIGWVAGNEHRSDAEQLRIAAIAERLISRAPNLEFISVGLGLGIDHPRYHRIPGVELLELTQVTAQFDIGIAPLADTRFNRARSNIKLKEYAAGGTPWLASDLGPYAGLGERQGGVRISNADWEAAILSLLGDLRRRRRLAVAGRQWARSQSSLAHTHEWQSVFEDAAVRARAAVRIA